MPIPDEHNYDSDERFDEFDLCFKVFHELMAKKVNEIRKD